jgi:hypothetical protein
MENKLILKKAAIATAITTMIFSLLVVIFEWSVCALDRSYASSEIWTFVLSLIMRPIEFLGYQWFQVRTDPFYLLTLNTVFYAISFAIIAFPFILLLTTMRKNK